VVVVVVVIVAAAPVAALVEIGRAGKVHPIIDHE